jgi:hypothetical protein
MNNRQVPTQRDIQAARTALEVVVGGADVFNHMQSEFVADLDATMDTVTKNEPVIYGMPVSDTGPLHLISERSAVHEHYKVLYEATVYKNFRAVLDIRSTWYVFTEGLSCVHFKQGNFDVNLQAAVLFPVAEEGGILGEMLITRDPATEIKASLIEGIVAHESKRDENHFLLMRFLEALRNCDTDVIRNCFSPDAQAVVRPYEASALFGGQQQAGGECVDTYRKMFDRFEIEDVKIVQSMVTEWYVFTELLWEVKERSTGEALAFCTADAFSIVAPGLIMRRIGWGTTPVNR